MTLAEVMYTLWITVRASEPEAKWNGPYDSLWGLQRLQLRCGNSGQGEMHSMIHCRVLDTVAGVLRVPESTVKVV